MRKYRVEVIRTRFSRAVVEVEAEDHHVAADRALAKAPDLDFGPEMDCDYECRDVAFVKEKEGDGNAEVCSSS